MSEYHHELSAYIGCGDTQRIVDGIVGLCSREGMRHIAPTVLPALHEAPSQNNYWGIAVLPGAPGWHVLLALPWNFLCERVSGGGPSRFIALCNALQAPGMLREVHGGLGGYAYGTVTLEADGQGREAISGFIWRHGEMEQGGKELTWHGYTLPEVASEAERARLIESVMPTDWTLDIEVIRSNVEEAHLCGEYAQRLVRAGKSTRSEEPRHHRKEAEPTATRRSPGRGSGLETQLKCRADGPPSMTAWIHFSRSNSRRLMVILTDRCRMTDLPHTPGGIPGRHHASGGHFYLARRGHFNLAPIIVFDIIYIMRT